MKNSRRKIDASLKAMIALEALREQATVADRLCAPTETALKLIPTLSHSGLCRADTYPPRPSINIRRGLPRVPQV